MYISLYNRSFSAFSNETQETDDDEMNISQEILVLDFGDEKSDFLRSETDFGKGTFCNTPRLLGITNLLIICRQNGYNHRAVSNKDVGAGAGCHLCPDDLGVHFNAVLLLYEEVDATAQSDCIDGSAVKPSYIFPWTDTRTINTLQIRRHVESHARTRKSQFEKTNIKIIGKHILKMLVATGL